MPLSLSQNDEPVFLSIPLHHTNIGFGVDLKKIQKWKETWLVDEHTIEYTYEVLQNCTPETYT